MQHLKRRNSKKRAPSELPTFCCLLAAGASALVRVACDCTVCAELKLLMRWFTPMDGGEKRQTKKIRKKIFSFFFVFVNFAMKNTGRQVVAISRSRRQFKFRLWTRSGCRSDRPLAPLPNSSPRACDNYQITITKKNPKKNQFYIRPLYLAHTNSVHAIYN